MSYLYEIKEHKSFDLRKKNEQVIGHIKNMLPNTEAARQIELERIAAYQANKAKEFDEEQARRANERKQKE